MDLFYTGNNTPTNDHIYQFLKIFEQIVKIFLGILLGGRNYVMYLFDALEKRLVNGVLRGSLDVPVAFQGFFGLN
jgi:hypothetical protein